MIEPRFYDPALSPNLRELRLDGDEGRHLARVLRLGPGAHVRVFDGRGGEVRAEIVTVEKSGALVRILETVAPSPEPVVDVTVVQAVLKGDGMDAVVRDATMMGVTAIQPVLTARTVVTTKALGPDGASAVARWRRVAIASAKQCGRARIPAIEPPRVLSAALRNESPSPRLRGAFAKAPAPDVALAKSAEGRGEGQAVRLILVEPVAAPANAADTLPRTPPASASLLVGPEGGWTSAEVDEAVAAGWTPWSLGGLTLRADAAALVALGALTHAWREEAQAQM
jgi:16S rRNA (uracil1498-N3)-methyltransferase